MTIDTIHSSESAIEVAVLSKWLASHDVKVCLVIPRHLNLKPPTAAIEALAPYMHIWYHYLVNNIEMVKDSDVVDQVPLLQTEDIRALAQASSLQELCVHLEDSLAAPKDCMPVIANLQSLLRLDLTISNSRIDASFEVLGHLSLLQSLALQIGGARLRSCSHVLISCRSTLRHVSLLAYSWDDQTYSALLSIPSLMTLVLKVSTMATSAAFALGSLSQPDSISVSMARCYSIEPTAFAALSSGTARIAVLTLRGVDDAQLQLLRPMEALKILLLIRCPITGEGMPMQPELSTLELVSCTALTQAGIERMVMALPKVQILTFAAEPDEEAQGDLQLSSQALVALTQLEHAETIDLLGVSRVSIEDLHAMLATYGQRDSATPDIFVSLVGYALPRMLVQDNIHLPSVIERSASFGRSGFIHRIKTRRLKSGGLLHTVRQACPPIKAVAAACFLKYAAALALGHLRSVAF